MQGVSFRFYATRAARETGVVGWIRNEVDGSVRGHFEGPPDAVDAMVAWCHEGSPYASVQSVEVSDSGPTGATSFTVDG